MNWSPGKLTIVKWDRIHSALQEPSSLVWYDILFQLKGSYPRKKGKYVFTCLHIVRLVTENKEVFNCIGRIKYVIRLEGKSLEVDLLMLLTDRSHRLFNEEFDKQKKATPWEGYEVPDYSLPRIRSGLEKIIF